VGTWRTGSIQGRDVESVYAVEDQIIRGGGMSFWSDEQVKDWLADLRKKLFGEGR
jgi:hypothetical protein